MPRDFMPDLPMKKSARFYADRFYAGVFNDKVRLA